MSVQAATALMTTAQVLQGLSTSFRQFKEYQAKARALTIDDPKMAEQREKLMRLISTSMQTEISEAQAWLVNKRQATAQELGQFNKLDPENIDTMLEKREAVELELAAINDKLQTS